MRKPMICITLGLLTLATAARADDDLFSRISLDSPFTGAKPSGGTPGEKAAPSDRPQKILNADHLAEMLRDADLDPKTETDDLVSVKYKYQRWNFPVAFNLTDHNSRLWIVFVLAKLDSGKQLKAEQMTGLLSANRDLRPAMFAFADGGKRIELYLALPNEQISAKVLRDNLQTMATVAENTAGLWEAAAAPPANQADRPSQRPAPNGQEPNGRDRNGNNGQIAKSDAPSGPPAPSVGGKSNTGNTHVIGDSQANTASTPANGLIGKWSASVGEKDAYALLLKADNSFVMVQVKDGKQSRVAGKFTFENGTLTLAGSDGAKIVGSVAKLAEKSFDFTPQGAGKLSFKRAS